MKKVRFDNIKYINYIFNFHTTPCHSDDDINSYKRSLYNEIYTIASINNCNVHKASTIWKIYNIPQIAIEHSYNNK